MTDDLFPVSGVSPTTTTDTISQFEFVLGNLSLSGFASGLLAAHAHAIATDNHALAAMLRSDALADLREAAGRYGHPRDERETMESARQRAGDAAVAKFKLGVCEQIAATKGHPLAAAARKYIAAARAAEQAERETAEQAAREQAERERAAAAERAAKKAEAERVEAELARAAEESQGLEARLRATRAEHRRLREQYFVAACRQLQDSGVSTIRLKSGFSAMFGRGAYAVADLIAQAPNLTDETLGRFERAVSDELERIDDAE